MAKATNKTKASQDVKTESDAPFAVEQLPAAQDSKILIPGEDVEERIKQEVRKYGVADAKIQELKEAFAGLEILPVPDPETATKEEKKAFKESYDKVKEAIGILRPLRTGVNKKREDLKADYLKIGKGIDDEAKRIVALISEIEVPLKEKLDAAEAKIEEQKKAKEREEQEKIQKRVHDLLEAGIKFDGSFYSIGEVSIDVVTLKSLTDESFEKLVGKVREWNKKIQEDEAAEAKRIQDEKDKFEEDKRKQQEEQDRLDKEKKDLEDQRAEMLKQKIQFRKENLEHARLSFVTAKNAFVYSTPSGSVEVRLDDIEQADDSHWNNILANARKLSSEIYDAEQKRIQEENAKTRENELKESRFQSRKEDLLRLGFVFIPNCGLTYRGVLTGKDIYITFEDVREYAPEGWALWFDKAVAVRLEIIAAEEAEKERREALGKRINERKTLLSKLGFYEDEKGVWFYTSSFNPDLIFTVSERVITEQDADIWTATVQEAQHQVNAIKSFDKSEADRLEREKEEARIAGLSDLQKVEEYLNTPTGNLPNVSQESPLYNAVRTYCDMITEARRILIQKVEAYREEVAEPIEN